MEHLAAYQRIQVRIQLLANLCSLYRINKSCCLRHNVFKLNQNGRRKKFVRFILYIFSKGHLRSAKLLAKVESHEAVSEILFWIPCTNSNSKVLPDLPWSSLVEGDEQANWPSSQIWMHVLHIFGTLCPQQLSTCADTSLHLLLLAPWACWHSFQTECSSASIYSLW